MDASKTTELIATTEFSLLLQQNCDIVVNIKVELRSGMGPVIFSQILYRSLDGISLNVQNTVKDLLDAHNIINPCPAEPGVILFRKQRRFRSQLIRIYTVFHST